MQEEACTPYLTSGFYDKRSKKYQWAKEKGAFAPPPLTTLRYVFDLGDAQQGDGCLTGMHTVASLADFAQPSNAPTLTAPAERLLHLGPSCLKSIAWGRAMEKSDKVGKPVGDPGDLATYYHFPDASFSDSCFSFHRSFCPCASRSPKLWHRFVLRTRIPR
jgi:hypothetical protein